MWIRIQADPPGPLEVLSELPAARLATLEGLNGIGKTLAVRLLQLCTGTMPYSPDSLAWKSLCLGLGEFTVAVGALQDVTEIRWQADSREWSSDVDHGEAPFHFREILINGNPATLDDVRRHLVVHRLAGDEGLVETLAQQADAEADIVARWTRRVALQDTGPLSDLEHATQDARDQLSEWTEERYRHLLEDVELAKVAVKQTNEVMITAQARLDAIEQALTLQRQLSEFRSRAPDLEQKLTEVDHDIEATRQQRESIQREITQLGADVVSAEPRLKELSNARNTLDRNRRNLTDAVSNTASIAAPLGIPPDRQAAEAFLQAADDRVAELTARRTELDAAPAMRSVLDQVTHELTHAESQGLGGQIALEDPETSLQLTLSQTRGGMLVRRAFLEGQPPAPQAREISERLAEAIRVRDRARWLIDAIKNAERYRRLVAENEKRVDAAIKEVNPNSVAELQRLELERRAKDESLLELASIRATLRQQLGSLGAGATEAALEGQLAEAVRLAGSTEASAEADAISIKQAAGVASNDLADARQRLNSGRRDLARADADIRRATETLSHSPRLDWVRAAISRQSLPTASAPPDRQLAALEAVKERLSSLSERLGNHRDQLGGIEYALRAMARHLRSQDMRASEYVAELQTWLGDRFSGWFNNPRVRQVLLPRATQDVVVDLGRREVTWVEGIVNRSRPLEAFSSGEQAFAYTRAWLAVLDDQESRPANRLIVLDEFGAFIAHDRLARLLEYLGERATEHPDDQLLVILPLSRDYGSMARSASPADAKRFEGYATAIAERRYAVRVMLS